MSEPTYLSLRLVSSNQRKLNEFRYLLGINHLDLSEIASKEHQDLNLEEIVRNKIADAKKILKDVPFFVEHSGLEIDAWKQLPGGLTGIFMRTVGPAGICRMLRGFDERDRHASAVSIIGFHHQDNVKIFRGVAYGKIAESPRASLDLEWDWDSIFIPDEGRGETYSEMGFGGKNRLSMRKKAAEEFLGYLKRSYRLEYCAEAKLAPGLAEEIVDLISSGDLNLPLAKLDEALRGTREHNAVVGLTARANRLLRDQRAGVLYQEDFAVERSKIVQALLEVVELLR